MPCPILIPIYDNNKNTHFSFITTDILTLLLFMLETESHVK